MIGLILQTWTMKTEDLLSETDLKEPSGAFSLQRNARFLRITFVGFPFVFQEHTVTRASMPKP